MRYSTLQQVAYCQRHQCQSPAGVRQKDPMSYLHNHTFGILGVLVHLEYTSLIPHRTGVWVLSQWQAQRYYIYHRPAKVWQEVKKESTHFYVWQRLHKEEGGSPSALHIWWRTRDRRSLRKWVGDTTSRVLDLPNSGSTTRPWPEYTDTSSRPIRSWGTGVCSHVKPPRNASSQLQLWFPLEPRGVSSPAV